MVCLRVCHDTAVTVGQACSRLKATAKTVDSRGWQAGSSSQRSPQGCSSVPKTWWPSASRMSHQAAEGRKGAMSSNTTAWTAGNVIPASPLWSQRSALSSVGWDPTQAWTPGGKVARGALRRLRGERGLYDHLISGFHMVSFSFFFNQNRFLKNPSIKITRRVQIKMEMLM